MKKRLALAAAFAFSIIPFTSFADNLEPDESEIKKGGELDLKVGMSLQGNIKLRKVSYLQLLSIGSLDLSKRPFQLTSGSN